MNTVAANDLKTQGVSSLNKVLKNAPEAMITVRGKNKFVVMKMDHYHYLREMELEAALLEAKRDVAADNTIAESVDAHVKRIFET